MSDHFARFKADLDRLVRQGGKIALAMQKQFSPTAKVTTDLSKDELAKLPDPGATYEAWYSESLALLKQLLPERVADFQSYYKPQTARKEILHSNYTMSDYLRGTTITRGGDVITGPSSAMTPIYQQFNIIQGLQNRFDSTLYDIRTLVHADLLDDELHSAEELNKNGYQRGAGAVCGVVLEGHLKAVVDRHAAPLKKKDPSISELNDALKNANILETATWRFIQHLGDLRNKCDHKKLPIRQRRRFPSLSLEPARSQKPFSRQT